MKLSDQQLRWICDNFIFLRVVQHRLPPPPLPHSILSGFRSLVPNYILVGGNWYSESEMSCLRNQMNDLARSWMWTSWLGVHHADRQFSWSLFFKTVSINGLKPGINNHVYNVIIWRKVVLIGIDISKSD